MGVYRASPPASDDDAFGATAFVVVLLMLVALGWWLYSTGALAVNGVQLPALPGAAENSASSRLLKNLDVVVKPTATAVPAAATVAAVAAANTQAKPAVVPTATLWTPPPTATPPQASPTPPGTPQPTVQSHMRVANTSGDGVYIRRTPNLGDRIIPWPENTVMEYLGEQVQANGLSWAKVRDPRGNVGWVPSQYLAG